MSDTDEIVETLAVEAEPTEEELKKVEEEIVPIEETPSEPVLDEEVALEETPAQPESVDL